MLNPIVNLQQHLDMHRPNEQNTKERTHFLIARFRCAPSKLSEADCISLSFVIFCSQGVWLPERKEESIPSLTSSGSYESITQTSARFFRWCNWLKLNGGPPKKFFWKRTQWGRALDRIKQKSLLRGDFGGFWSLTKLIGLIKRVLILFSLCGSDFPLQLHIFFTVNKYYAEDTKTLPWRRATFLFSKRSHTLPVLYTLGFTYNPHGVLLRQFVICSRFGAIYEGVIYEGLTRSII